MSDSAVAKGDLGSCKFAKEGEGGEHRLKQEGNDWRCGDDINRWKVRRPCRKVGDAPSICAVGSRWARLLSSWPRYRGRNVGCVEVQVNHEQQAQSPLRIESI